MGDGGDPTHNFISHFQDAHEFLIFLINHINEIIVGEQAGGGNGPGNNSKNRPLGETDPDAAPTWINEIFQVGLFDILNPQRSFDL